VRDKQREYEKQSVKERDGERKKRQREREKEKVFFWKNEQFWRAATYKKARWRNNKIIKNCLKFSFAKKEKIILRRIESKTSKFRFRFCYKKRGRTCRLE
jgi:hypothetical protein